VRTIIQNTKTGEYLRKGEWTADRSLATKTGTYLREEEWTADRNLAQSFRNVDEAVHYRFKHVLKAEMQVIFQPGDEPSEWDVTVSRE
jgi:hypothetical protein